MPIEWSADPERRVVNIALTGASLESEYLALIRGVATVTNRSGGFAILMDVESLTHTPGYAEIVRLCQEVWRLRSPRPDYIAIITPQSGAVYGKSRQLVSVMAALGLEVDLFEDEVSALRWCAAKQGLAVR